MSKTTENIKAAFAGESQARNKYTYFAEVARQEGYHYIDSAHKPCGSTRCYGYPTHCLHPQLLIRLQLVLMCTGLLVNLKYITINFFKFISEFHVSF